MSTLASKVRALERHRMAVAREILRAIPQAITFRHLGPTGTVSQAGNQAATFRERRLEAMLDGRGTFDVHAAREHALHLVDPLHGPLAELEAFTDWTRAKGLGPENREPGAFGVKLYAGNGSGAEAWRGGGWPGKLAREWAWERCPNECKPTRVTCPECDGARFTGHVYLGHGDYEPESCERCDERGTVRGPRTHTIDLGEGCVETVYSEAGEYLGESPGQRYHVQECHECTNGRARTKGRDSRAPMGRSLARLGQRILDMLEGQPSECQRLTCSRGRDFMRIDYKCPDCHGTGHNLQGKLPEVEWSPAVRRKVTEAERARGDTNQQRDGWTFAILDSFDGWTLTRWDHERGEIVRDERTRVCPRGEHRDCWQRVWSHPTEGDPDLDRRIEARMRYDQWARQPGQPPRHDPRAEDGDRLPAWRRGEIEHARQRREREARRVVSVILPGRIDSIRVTGTIELGG